MRADIATLAITLGLVCCAKAAPTFSCFDPPDEGQTNPLGEGLEDVVEEECCEALVDESDVLAGRLVVWDPVNCNHGPGEDPIAEGFLCRAHDTDGCRFCRESCDDFEGLCITCAEILEFDFRTGSPTQSPFFSGSDFPETPSPVVLAPGATVTPFATEAPFGIFPETPAPSTAAPVETPAPTVDPDNAGDGAGGGGDDDECPCVAGLSETEAEVLAIRGKAMVCDPTCSDGSDLTWGVMNCNYFALGQDCRACSDICEDSGDGTWLDQDGAFCKPCSAVQP
eukprot:jgi/Undpi1/254/HiC_scaffold_1.g00251.m1